jgi:hypothetical protein
VAYQNMIIEAQQLAHPVKDRQPFQLSGVTEEGMEIALKIWPDNPALKIFEQDQAGFPAHYEISAESKFSDFTKTDEWTLSKRGMPKMVSTDGNGSQRAAEAPQRAPIPSPAPAPQKQRNTPQGVMTGSGGDRERSIQAQAIIKSVIAMDGTEADVQRWLDCHDRIVKGERVGG